MTLIHDAFLFKPELFLKTISPYILALNDTDKGYKKLRNDALLALENNPLCAQLAREYGGWSPEAIKLQIPDVKPESIEDIAFWLVILLYNNLEIGKDQLGLGSDFDLLSEILQTLKWDQDQRDLLIWGHHFKDLPVINGDVALSKTIQENAHQSVWKLIKPFSTSSRAGWIYASEIVFLKKNLGDIDMELFNVRDLNTNQTKAAFEAASRMLSSAKDLKSGLCLILSG